jgi:hypothetical protein
MLGLVRSSAAIEVRLRSPPEMPRASTLPILVCAHLPRPRIPMTYSTCLSLSARGIPRGRRSSAYRPQSQPHAKRTHRETERGRVAQVSKEAIRAANGPARTV